jgi:NAD(P)-dependent dehydrogenase (short-subunit alcohol dehydrogenase family)
LKEILVTEMRFDDDVVIITGAGRGLGREHAIAFAQRGAAVVVNDIGVESDGDGGSAAVAQAVVDEIRALGGRAIADTHSVATAEGAQAVVRAALDAFGKVTVLVNNAGIIGFATLEQIDDDSWRRMMAVTLDGAFQMSKAIWPHFATQKHGRIINTTSNAGFAGNETLVHYGAAKLGVAGFTKALAQEVGDTGITVNAIAPMAITRMNRDAFFGGANVEGDDWQDDIRRGIAPMGPASAVSPTVLWLAHRTTSVNGDIYSASSGKVGRVGFVVGEGYFNPGHTPEDLRDNLQTVRSLDNYLDPTCTRDELALIPPLFNAL